MALKQAVETMEAREKKLSQEINNIIYKNTTSVAENQKGVSQIFQKAQ